MEIEVRYYSNPYNRRIKVNSSMQIIGVLKECGALDDPLYGYNILTGCVKLNGVVINWDNIFKTLADFPIVGECMLSNIRKVWAS